MSIVKLNLFNRQIVISAIKQEQTGLRPLLQYPEKADIPCPWVILMSRWSLSIGINIRMVMGLMVRIFWIKYDEAILNKLQVFVLLRFMSSSTFPPQFGLDLSGPLVYVEWFTLLGLLDLTTGMHIVKHSTRHHKRNSKIVSINNLVSGCHLTAKCGTHVDKSFSTDDVLKKATQFYVNPYIHVDTKF